MEDLSLRKNELLLSVITNCEKQIEQIIKKISEIADTTENEKLYDYLSYSHDGYYLLNIHDETLLSHLDLSEDDKKIIEQVYNLVDSNVLSLIYDIFDDMYDYYNDKLDTDYAKYEDIVATLSNIQVDLEDDLISSLSSIDELKKLMEN